jgi:pimeloyl-ACP methyl ester carboxylesterase
MPDFRSEDGLKLYYSDEGEGLPVLALAGLTRNSSDFDYLDQALEGFRLIRLDSRGRGRSDWADPSTYTVLQESRDAMALLDHLEIEKAAIIGTSRGGLIAMTIAATAKERLLGVALNDVGPVIDPKGLKRIAGYIGQKPPQKSYAELAELRAKMIDGFVNVPIARWRSEVMHSYRKVDGAVELRYDPRLRDGVLAALEQPLPDLWPFFDALADLPLALIRGENSELLTSETAKEMQRRRPDMIFAEVPDRGHVPFLDEDEALIALSGWLELMQE